MQPKAREIGFFYVNKALNSHLDMTYSLPILTCAPQCN